MIATLPGTLGHSERQALLALAAWLRDRFGPRLADLRLFGSRARGEGHEESDLDVLVAIDDLTSDERMAIWFASGHLQFQFDVTVSTFTLSTERWRQLVHQGRLIAREIERDGIPL
jgi:uncharacterized protein